MTKQEYEATIADLRERMEKAERIAQQAYNEGFCEGTKEHTHFNGGKDWLSSKSFSRLAELGKEGK